MSHRSCKGANVAPVIVGGLFLGYNIVPDVAAEQLMRRMQNQWKLIWGAIKGDTAGHGQKPSFQKLHRELNQVTKQEKRSVFQRIICWILHDRQLLDIYSMDLRRLPLLATTAHARACTETRTFTYFCC
jgi:hypothetical protein